MLALGALLSLQGCAEKEPDRVKPQATQMTQNGEGEGPTAEEAATAWNKFVTAVVNGEITDPLGQYVSKSTQITPTVTDSIKISRPKYDGAYTVSFVQNSQGDWNVQRGFADPENPPQPCEWPNCPPTYGSGNTVQSHFESSLGEGGTGNIRDLKLIANSSVPGIQAPAGYSKLNADLNRGAGGNYIYLCFTREQNSVISGQEYNDGENYSSPASLVRSFEIALGGFFGAPKRRPINYFHMWRVQPNQSSLYHCDLNGGAGGEYIYSFQSKNPNAGFYEFSEVGILYGNSPNIQPPANWNKFPYDLNKGAGGDFIYFCYKI